MKNSKLFFTIAALMFIACEQREEPAQFKLDAEPTYAFTETADAAEFSVTSNIPWTAAVTGGAGDWCSITPEAAKGDDKVKIAVTKNNAYLQERTATIVVTADEFKAEITVTQAPQPCPAFSAGSIASNGQTIAIGGTPETINSVQDASGGGEIAYQWYKDGEAISGATAASYTPPAASIAAAGIYTYTRHAKDNTCNTTFTQSTGSWALTVIACNFSAGTISSAGQTIAAGDAPAAINSIQDASGGGVISYQWYKDGTAISDATAAGYTPPMADATVAGTYIYTRRAKDNVCSTALTQSAGSWALTVIACNFSAGTISSAGQAIAVGGTPVAISSLQDASGGEEITYQWYKGGAAINGATTAGYTPPSADAAVAGTYIYTRRTKDNVCNTTLTQSAGSWALTVVACNFNTGSINSTGQTVAAGGMPATISSVQDATGGGAVAYQWHKDGEAINGTAANYTPPAADAVVTGTHIYTRYAKDNVCNTTLTQSTGSWALTVITCNFSAGTIASAGQIIAAGGTPEKINSLQNASGNGNISYQWYKDGEPINGATAIDYTPTAADAAAAGIYVYTRHVKDDICSITPTQSAGSWALTVIACNFTAGTISSAGQTVLAGGTPAAINSVQGASGGGTVTYQWYKNGEPIGDATSANYTPPPEDAATTGTRTYTRRAKDNVCNITLAQSTGSWVLTVVPCIFNPGAITTDGQTICSGGAVNTIASSVDATGGDNISYQWQRNGSNISGATAATYSPVAYNTTTGAHTFTRQVYDGSCNTGWSQSAGSWILTVIARTQLTLTTANDNQHIVNGTAITPIQYATVNASTATCSGLPDGITATWASNTLTISGNSTATGAHAYLITATGMDGCSDAYASGSIQIYPVGIDEYGCVVSNLTLGTVGFASTVTHVVSGAYGSQTWSAPVTATYCEKTTYNGGMPDAFQSDCRSSTQPSYGHLFSWCMVEQYAAQLCPDPWRVPTSDDYCTLDRILNNQNYCGSSEAAAAYVVAWGGVYNRGVEGSYWSSTEHDSFYARYLHFNTNGYVHSQNTSYKDERRGLRCVK